MELRNYPKPKHLSSDLPNTNSYFLATKHEKNNWYGMQLFKFFHTENTSKQQKMVAGFCEELLSENDFEAVLINFCCYEYIIVPMLLRQFRSKD